MSTKQCKIIKLEKDKNKLLNKLSKKQISFAAILAIIIGILGKTIESMPLTEIQSIMLMMGLALYAPISLLISCIADDYSDNGVIYGLTIGLIITPIITYILFLIS